MDKFYVQIIKIYLFFLRLPSIKGKSYSGTLTEWAEKGFAVLKNEERTISAEYIPNDTEEIVSDLLCTLFLSMDEYVTYLRTHGYSVGELTKMQSYIEKEMQKYVKILYHVEVEIFLQYKSLAWLSALA